jgi:peptide/nickel transport system substrate-binding protein
MPLFPGRDVGDIGKPAHRRSSMSEVPLMSSRLTISSRGVFRRVMVAVALVPLLVACAPGSSSTTAKPAAPAAAPAAAPVTAASPVAAPADPNVKTGGVAKIGLYQEPILLNPMLGSQTAAELVSRNIIEGLVQATPDGNYAPLLAAEVPTIQNGGVTADGLTVTWKMIMNSGNPIPVRSGYPEIESVTAPDELTAVVKYKKLYSAYRDHFNWVFPAHAFNAPETPVDKLNTLIDKKDFNRAPFGTGPFKFKSWASGDNITLEKNPNYREPGKPYLDGLIFKITPSREAAVQSFKAGELDGVWNLTESNLAEFEAMADASLAPLPSDRVERLILNTSCPSGPQMGDPACPHPVLGDIRVRQAIELAIDKKAIVDKLLFGKTTVASSVVPVGWYAPTLQPTPFDPNKAKQLLDEAGFVPGADGIRSKAGVRAHLEYGTTTGDRLREQTQQVIQEMLKNVGIELEIKNVPSPVLLGGWVDNAARAKGNFDMLMWTTNATLDPQGHLDSYFSSNQIPTDQTRSGRNYHRIQDPELDQAIVAGGATVDDAARKAAYKTAAERINADKGHIVLYNRLQLDALKKYLKGQQPTIWSDFTWDSENWWLDK